MSLGILPGHLQGRSRNIGSGDSGPRQVYRQRHGNGSTAGANIQNPGPLVPAADPEQAATPVLPGISVSGRGTSTGRRHLQY